MPVQRRFGDSGALGDLIEADIVHAAASEQFVRGGQDPFSRADCISHQISDLPLLGPGPPEYCALPTGL
jgi:hypothetical protein